MAIAVELVAVHRAALAKAGEARAKSTIGTIDNALMVILIDGPGIRAVPESAAKLAYLRHDAHNER
jgi:hypothetical protein